MRNRFRIFGRALAFLMDLSNPSSMHVSNAPLRSVPSVSITRSQVSARCCARVCTNRLSRHDMCVRNAHSLAFEKSTGGLTGARVARKHPTC